MSKGLKRFKERALAHREVKREYDRLAEEFEFLDEILKARATTGLTQADVRRGFGFFGVLRSSAYGAGGVGGEHGKAELAGAVPFFKQLGGLLILRRCASTAGAMTRSR